jgi:hypothetical protein
MMMAGYYATISVLVGGSTKEISLYGDSIIASRWSGTIKQLL